MVHILQASRGDSTRERFLGQEVLTLANSFDHKKYSASQRINAAKRIIAKLLKVSKKDFPKMNQASRDLALKIGKELAKQAGGVGGESPQSWNPSNENRSYTNVDLSSSGQKGVKQNSFSQFNLNDCVNRYKAANPGMPESWYHQQCAESLGGISFRQHALTNTPMHMNVTGNSVNSTSTPKFTEQLPTLNQNSPNTPLHFGKKRSALQKGREAIALADKLSAEMTSFKQASYQPIQKPAWIRNHDRLFNGLETQEPRIKSGNYKGDPTSFLKNRAYLLNDGFRNEMSVFNGNTGSIKSANVDKSIPAWIRNRTHTLEKVGGLD